MFESCVFRNNGDGTFGTEKLPVEAQFSPVRDIMVSDINHDGIKDLVSRREQLSGKTFIWKLRRQLWLVPGWRFIWWFKTMMPVESGLIIKGDARRVLPLKVSQKNYIVVAVNDGELQLFEVQSDK